MAGRRPKPSRVKEIQGNPGKRPLNKLEPKPTPSIPDCPEHLDAMALEEWNRIAPELHKLKILSRIHRAVLACYCQAWSRWVDAENNIRKYGAVVKTPKGYPIQSPYLSISNKAQEMMLKCATEFGLTPSSMSRINATEQQIQPVDAWEQFESPEVVKPN